MRKVALILAFVALAGCANIKNGRETWTGEGKTTRSKPATSTKKMKTRNGNTVVPELIGMSVRGFIGLFLPIPHP